MLSAYRISASVWIVNTAINADPNTPTTLPIGSVVLSYDEARAFAEQILAAIPAKVAA